MRVVEFQRWHIGALKQRSGDAIALEEGFRAQLRGTTRALTVIDELDRPVALFGIVMPYPRVGYVWARVSDLARGRGLALTRAARECIVRIGATLPLRQIRAEVLASNSEYNRWLKLLGFEPEGIKYGAAPDGGDLVEHVRWMTYSEEVETPPSQRSRPRTTGECGATTPAGWATSKIAGRPH